MAKKKKYSIGQKLDFHSDRILSYIPNGPEPMTRKQSYSMGFIHGYYGNADEYDFQKYKFGKKHAAAYAFGRTRGRKAKKKVARR